MCMCICLFIHLHYTIYILKNMQLTFDLRTIQSQYIVWPVTYNLDAQTSRLLKKWMYGAFTDIVLEQLRYKYFSIKLCQPGLAGKNCDQSCDRKNGQSDRDGTCICKSTKWTGDDCSIEVQENLNLYPSWEVALCYALFGINALSCIICAIWIYWKRSNKLVQLSQPFFLNFILLGCVISSSAIIPLVQQSAGDGPVHACAVFPWLFCVGFSITFGTLFAKIRRIVSRELSSLFLVHLDVHINSLVVIASLTVQTVQGLSSGNESHCHGKENTDHHWPYYKCRYLDLYSLDRCESSILDSRGYNYRPIWGAPGICWVLYW